MKDQITRLEASVSVLEKEHRALKKAHEETHESLKEQSANITKIYDTLLAYVTRNSSK